MNAQTTFPKRLGTCLQEVRSWNPAREAPGEELAYIDLGAIDNDRKAITKVQRIFGKAAPSRARQLVRSGDVLVSTVRPYLNGVARVPDELDGATASTGFCVLRAEPTKTDGSYLFHWVRSPAFVADMVRQSTGASYPAVSDRIIHNSFAPLPSLPEQKRIAAILDQADEVVQIQRRAEERLWQYPAALLDQLLGLKGVPPVNTRNKVPEGAEGSRWVTLTDVARLATGHTPDRKVEEYWNGTIPWISLTDIRALDGRIATDTIQRVSDQGIANSSSVILPEGTVCLARTASVGFSTIMGREMATSQDFVNWVCGPELEPIYLLYAILASRKELKALAPGSTHKTIYFPTVQSFRLLLPPIEIQKRFAQSVRQFWTIQDTMKGEQQKLQMLFTSLQHQAFHGEL